MIFHSEKNEIIALLDWELSTLGHPYADLAYHCMQWRLPRIGRIKGLAGLDCTTLGIPTEENFIADYCRRLGIGKIPNWNFYLAFSFFRLAAIVQGVKKRALMGNASSDRALEIGKLVQPLAEMGFKIFREEN
jgi:aminoglycoside phosphotransferase (APT) family kinase protein